MYLVRKVYLLEELFSSYIIIRVLIIIIRDIFNWESKVIQDCIGLTLLRSVIGPESSCHFLNQLDVKSNTNHDLVARVFPRFRQFGCFYLEFASACKDLFLSSDWLLWFLLFCFNVTQSKSSRLKNKG